MASASPSGAPENEDRNANKRRRVDTTTTTTGGSQATNGYATVSIAPANSSHIYDEGNGSEEAAAHSPSYDDFRSVVLSRSFLGRYCNTPYFAKLVTGFFVRYQVSQGVYHLFRIDQLVKAKQAYKVTGVWTDPSRQTSTRSMLRCFDVSNDPPTEARLCLDRVSNSPPTEEEYKTALRILEKATRSRADDLRRELGLSSIVPTDQNADRYTLEKAGKLRWYGPLTKDILYSLKDSRDRILRDQENGAGAYIVTEEKTQVPWGCVQPEMPKHEVKIVLRSWIANSTAVGAEPDDISLPKQASSSDADINRYSPGMNDEIQKYAGEYAYLFLHSKSDELCLFDATADYGYDELQPEITAWRGAREILGYVPLNYFKYAIVARLEFTGSVADDSVDDLPPSARKGGLRLETVEKYGSVEYPEYKTKYPSASDEQLNTFTAVAASSKPWEKRTTREKYRTLNSRVQVFFLDIDILLRLGQVKNNVIRRTARRFGQKVGASTRVWPSGVLWMGEKSLMSLQDENTVSHQGVNFSRVVREIFRSANCAYQYPFVYPRRRGNFVRLYHGTSVDNAIGVLKSGFTKPRCKKIEQCKRGDCCCQMEGFGIYLGRREKGLIFAARSRASLPKDYNTLLKEAQEEHYRRTGSSVTLRLHTDSTDNIVQNHSNGAAIIETITDLGHCKVAQNEPDPSGIRSGPHGEIRKFLDHNGTWYAWEGYDSLYLRDNSQPASNTAEWCVVDPCRVHIHAVHIIPVPENR
eukprot:gb/GECG01015597.1/.p1 GENE.gb/GECG01015597.1/~~gb/GECG01015597.1/.p1  ORF type:complete len:752 (+),score=78.43 gb/GECG01015597.1/:1-2256(+)